TGRPPSSCPKTTPGSPTRSTGPAGRPSPRSGAATAGGTPSRTSSTPRRRTPTGGWCPTSWPASTNGYACRAYLEGAAAVTLPTERVPQLREVDATVHALSGFHIEPVPGLVPTREFYGALADRVFLSTQYIRHHSVPFYTPEPDIVHEIIGHANMLGNPVFADLYEAAGAASRRAETDEALDFFSRVFWFTVELGGGRGDGGLKAYGAGLLSADGELEVFRDADIRPWDIRAMGTLDYDIARYQPILFAAESFDRMVDDLGSFFEGYD